MLAEVRAEKGAELDDVYTRIIDEATAQLLDRLKNGDPYVFGGEVKRKPVGARDLALVAAIAFDKRQLARNLPVGRESDHPSEMSDLWERLGKWSRDHPVKGASIAVVPG